MQEDKTGAKKKLRQITAAKESLKCGNLSGLQPSTVTWRGPCVPENFAMRQPTTDKRGNYIGFEMHKKA
jgi:hypothetical protein